MRDLCNKGRIRMTAHPRQIKRLQNASNLTNKHAQTTRALVFPLNKYTFDSVYPQSKGLYPRISALQTVKHSVKQAPGSAVVGPERKQDKTKGVNKHTNILFTWTSKVHKIMAVIPT